MFIYVTSNLMNIQSKTTNIRLALKDIALSKYVFEHENSQNISNIIKSTKQKSVAKNCLRFER